MNNRIQAMTRFNFSSSAAALVLVVLCTTLTPAQRTFNYLNTQDSTRPDTNPRNFKCTNLIIPAVLIGFGVVSLESDGLKELNRSTREEIFEHRPRHISLDNYTQYAPAALVYGLNAAGVKGKHGFVDRTMIYATSQMISAAFVVPLKHIVREERPDGSDNLSFPSGHTATAFSSAQFMFREYRGTNFWLSISGYSFATFTGVYRTINNKHWVGDVVAGAGFGILSTELAYCFYPKISKLLKRKKKTVSTMIFPTLQNRNPGLGLVRNF